MRSILPVARRELAAFLNAPAGALVIVAAPVFALAWTFFVERFFARNEASLRTLFDILPLVLVVLAPAVTMRAWAEERRSGTLELLLSLPASPLELAVGKFLGAWALLALSVAVTLPAPFALAPFGDFDAGAVAAQYLGILLLAGTAAAVGQWVSSRSENQVGAFLGSALALLGLTLSNRVNDLVELPGFIAGFLDWLSMGRHFEAFARGVVDTRDLAWYASIGAFFIVLASGNLPTRKRS